jgi:hypothetical protein
LLEQLKWLSYLWINSAQSGCLFRSLSSHEVIAGGRLLHGIEKKFIFSQQTPNYLLKAEILGKLRETTSKNKSLSDCFAGIVG